jgi:hypothetical protein
VVTGVSGECCKAIKPRCNIGKSYLRRFENDVASNEHIPVVS